MRVSYSLGSVLTIDEVLSCARHASQHGPDTVWIPETWGMEAFAMLGAVSQLVPSRVGSSIINVYSRSPAAVAMGAATVDTLSGGRLILGLGSSSPAIVGGLHGYSFEDPLGRMREYVRIIRMITAGEKIEHSGPHFELKGFRLLIRPPRRIIPVYLAAVNSRMTRLAWEIGDGVIFYLRRPGELKRTVGSAQSGKKIDVACQIITAVSEDSERAVTRAKKTLAFYVAVGDIYRKHLASNGYKRETGAILESYRKSGLGSLHESVPDSMVRDLALCGTPDEARAGLARFVDAGVTHPIIQFNPVGDAVGSFELVSRTFAGDIG